MKLTEAEMRMVFQIESTNQNAALNEIYMTWCYAPNPATKDTAEGLLDKLRPLSDQECMDLIRKDFHSIFLGLDRKGWIAAAVGVVGMCVNCQNCEAVGKLFAGLWEKACLFPSGCEWFFHRHERQFSIFP